VSPTEDLLVYVYVLIDDLITAGSIAVPSRPGPDGLHARFGCDAAHAAWFYAFRLAIKTDPGSRIVRAWSVVPAAINERDVATGLLETRLPPHDLLVEKGFNGKALAAGQADRGTAVLPPPAKGKRLRMPRSWGKSSPSGATGSGPSSARSPTRGN
jgi:hypothetical protein